MSYGASVAPPSLQMPVMQQNYNQHSRHQSQALQIFKPFLNSAVVALSPDLSSRDSHFVIADFGCSTGLNSSEAVSHVIREVRNKYGDTERCSSVLVVLNDLPANHWSELFGFMHGDERSLMTEHRGVFVVASGKSFYEQVLPSNTLHFGISNICIHWCSQLPVKISNHCYYMLGTDEERELFKQQAAKDWNSFLSARSKELVRGGVIALTVVTPERECDKFFDAMYQSTNALLTRGIIEHEELVNFNLSMYFRSVEEVSDLEQYHLLGLELLLVEKFPLRQSAYYEEFLVHGDTQKFAEEVTKSRMVVVGASFKSALRQGRSEQEKATICQEFSSEHCARVQEQPMIFQYTWNSMAVVIKKI